ncbi:MAG: trypsin-like peptidase domain-containing protein, partial [bacterium]
MSERKLSYQVTRKSLLLVLAVMVLAVVSVFVFNVKEGYASVNAGQDRPINTLRDLNQAYIDIADQVRPAVVTVSTERVLEAPSMSFGDPSFFEYFFGRPNGQPQQPQREFHQRGLGSGVIIKSDGLILTNNHVVDGADSIYVRTYSGKRYVASVVGVDPHTDIAVIRIPADDLPAIPVSNSDELQVGEIVLAVGSPMSEN